MPSEELQLFESGMALMALYPDDARHPLIREEKEKIAALGCVLSLTAMSGTADPEQLINLINVILETCYCLGYQAGKNHIEIGKVWDEAL